MFLVKLRRRSYGKCLSLAGSHFKKNHCSYDMLRVKTFLLSLTFFFFPARPVSTQRPPGAKTSCSCSNVLLASVRILQRPSETHTADSYSHQVIHHECTHLLTLPTQDLSLYWTPSTWTFHQASVLAEPPAGPEKEVTKWNHMKYVNNNS